MNRGICLMCSIVLASGICHARGPDLGTEAQRAAGKRIYEKKCAQCHGEKGDGRGAARSFFKPTPRDLTAGRYKIRTTPSGELPTDHDLKSIIRKGMPYTGMPGWPGLSDEELSNVVYYIKTFDEYFADPDAIVTPIEMPRAPRFSEESAEKGRKVYEENKCADCHGEHGRGDGKSAPTLKDESGEPIRAADLTKRWTFRGGSKRQDIYRTFTTGVNGTPMPSYADLISEEDRWRLVDYVFSLSRDKPEYSTVVVAVGTETDIDLDEGKSIFDDASPAFIPVFGQIIEPGREFYPSANAVEIRAVYNASEIAIMLTWHDMSAERSGSNGPTMPVPRFDPERIEGEAPGAYSDAVAIQTPSNNLPGLVKPYFLFGDRKNSVDIWFVDLARDVGELFVGRGSDRVERTGEAVPVRSTYEDGQWNVIFTLGRHREGGFPFDEGSFVPVAFSMWDGFNGERGSRRGVTSWYQLYLQPMRTESKAIRVAGFGILTLLIEVAMIQIVRKRTGPRSPKRSA